MVWLRFTVVAIWASGLSVIVVVVVVVVVVEGWYDRERLLLVWDVCRATGSSHSVAFVVAHDRNVCRSTMEGEFCPPVSRVTAETIKVRPVI